MISLILQHFLSQNMVGLLREERWRWIVERLVTSDKVPEGGHLSFFSRPHICLDIVTPCGRSGNRFLNKPSVWKHT